MSMHQLEIQSTNAEDFIKHKSAYSTFIKRMSKDEGKVHIISNMDESEPSGLLYLIQKERNEHRRWTKDNGQIDLLYDVVSGSVVGVSAVEESDLDTNYASGGNRLWMDKDYRINHNITKYLLNSNLEWAKDKNKKGMILTFNEYNKLIWEVIADSYKTGTTPSSFGGVWSDWWTDCIPIEDPIIVHSTKQWAVIKPINADKEEIKSDIGRIQNEHQ